MTLFTIHLELGPETRATIERLARDLSITIEVGTKTRALLGSLIEAGSPSQGDDEGLLRKAAKATVRSK